MKTHCFKLESEFYIGTFFTLKVGGLAGGHAGVGNLVNALTLFISIEVRFKIYFENNKEKRKVQEALHVVGGGVVLPSSP